MNSILNALISALAFVFSSRKTISDLQAHVADLTKINSDLHDALASQATDGSATTAALRDQLQQSKDAQAAAETNLAKINTDIADANAKAAELSDAINSDPSIPITVDHETGTATVDPVVPVVPAATPDATPVPPADSPSPVTAFTADPSDFPNAAIQSPAPDPQP